MKKIRFLGSLLTCVMLVVVLFYALSTEAKAASVSSLTFAEDPFRNGYRVIACDTNAKGKLSIPATYNGKPVTQILSDAFNNCTGLTTVEIPASVVDITISTFDGCSSLEKIVVDSKNAHYWSDSKGVVYNKDKTILCIVPDGLQGDYEIHKNAIELVGNAFSDCVNLTAITFPEGFTTVGYSAFKGCTGLKTVTFSSTVNHIGDYAFTNCDSLERVNIADVGAWCTLEFGVFDGNPLEKAHNLYLNGKLLENLVIPQGVTAISRTAFDGCTNLKTVQIPNSVTDIGFCAFNNCTALTSVTIPGTVTSVGDSAFRDCTSLKTVKISNGVVNVGNLAFAGCTKLTSISIPDSVTWTGSQIFDGCTNLSSVSIGKGLKEISAYAFLNCTSLKKFVVPNWITSIDAGAFEGCTGLSSVTLSSNLTKLGDGAFRDCDSLTTISIPDGVTEIESSTFYSCGGLTSIKLPSKTKTIGMGAFSGCANLPSITIPSTVTRIYDTAFNGCSSLIRVDISDIGAWCAIDFGMPDSNPMYYGAEMYLNGEPIYELVLPKTVKEVKKYAFFGCYNLLYLEIPDHVTSIGESAFAYCGNLYIADIGNGITVIPKNIFNSCNNLMYVTMSDSVISIGESAFSMCTELISISMSEKIESIGEGAFLMCKKLPAIALPSTITTVGDGAFQYCAALETVYYGGTRQKWNQLSVGEGNSYLQSAEILYNARVLRVQKYPSNTMAANGSTARVDISATGDGLTYQWYYKNAGASKFTLTTSFTGKSYSVKMNDDRDGRQVYCVITDKYGNYAETDPVTLRMGNPLKITKQPVSVAVAKGKTAKLTVSATGDGLTYKWYYKNASASKFSYTSTFKGSTYTISAMDSSRNGRQVYCVITDKYGNSVTTITVTLTMQTPLKITKQPVSVTVASGKAAKVTVSATGDGLTYKWYYKNASASKFSYTSTFKGSSYFVEMASVRNGRQVYCVITDKYGNSVITKTVTLTMQTPLKITKQPVSVTVASGKAAKVTVSATGDGLTYKWYYKNASASKFSYTSTFKGSSYFVEMASVRNGRQVYCVITDKYGNSVTTKTVTLTMQTPLKITKQPVSVTVAKGKTAKVTVSATGDGLTYKWYYKNASASKFSYTSTFKGSAYTISAMDTSRNGRQVYCVITDKYGNSVTTKTVTMTMQTPLKITKQPTSVTVAKGKTAKVTVSATGDGLTYKWYYKNASASKFSYTSTFKGSTYTISAMDASRNGRQVYCVITDKYGNSVKTYTVTLKMK